MSKFIVCGLAGFALFALVAVFFPTVRTWEMTHQVIAWAVVTLVCWKLSGK